ncbi:MAG: septal ring lytic transglycosylase RlpA family protein [Kiloniellales bacterium]
MTLAGPGLPRTAPHGRPITWIALVSAILLAACASTPGPGYVEEGIASWYGSYHHGRRTASGERFDMNAATAAHPTLPFGTLVRVTNLDNGRSLVLRINDRGPFVGDRIIDVSRAAARQLGFLAQGLAQVRVQRVAAAGS